MSHFADINTCFVKVRETIENLFKIKNYPVSSIRSFQFLKEKLLIFNTQFPMHFFK